MYTGTLFLFIAAQYSTEWTYNTLFIHSLRYYSGCFQRFIIMITKAQVFQLCSRLFEPLWVLCISTQNFKNILPISTKACWDYDWNYFGISFQFSGNWQCDNVHFSIHEHGLPLYSFRVFLFLSFFFFSDTHPRPKVGPVNWEMQAGSKAGDNTASHEAIPKGLPKCPPWRPPRNVFLFL